MNRRSFLSLTTGAAVAGAARVSARGAPAIVTSDRLRPATPGGVQVGDVTASRAIVWSATDRPARLVVEYARHESMAAAKTVVGPSAVEESAFTARVDVGGLPPGEMVFYRVRFESLAHPGTFSEPLTGSFRTAPAGPRSLTLAWSADTVGQGWGINPDFGGLKLYETMLRHAPDVFVHSGDMIYADNPVLPEVRLSDGRVWKNLVTPAKSKVAETLDEFRGNYAYNLLDTHMRRFNAAVPMVAQWDDHEVMNNWHPGMPLEGDARYTEKSIARLAARAKRAMFEYVPLRSVAGEPERVYRSLSYGPRLELFVLDERSYRGPNNPNRQESVSEVTAMLGRAQLDWLKSGLKASGATWKVIASDMPVGLVVKDADRNGHPAFEAFANGEGPPLGRELELAELFSFLKAEGIRNTLWITADVHYAAAHHYAPDRAVFRDFLPFWEFVAGPLNAGTFGPGALDPTFGPAVRYQSATPGMPQNRSPLDGHQFFGTLAIDGATARLTASLFNLADERLFSVDLEP